MAAADALYLQNHSHAVVMQFMRFLALQYDPLFDEDQEALEGPDLLAVGLAAARGAGGAGGAASHAALKAAGKKTCFDVVDPIQDAAAVGGGGGPGGGGRWGGRTRRGCWLGFWKFSRE